MTETTEHITESYIRHCLRWFTNSNIKSKGGKEIDILAIDKEGNKYWIECGVTHKKNFALKSKAKKEDSQTMETKDGDKIAWKRKNSVDYFVQNKFNNLKLKDTLKNFGFKENNYKKIIVCWQMKDKETQDYAELQDIEVWELKEKMKELMENIGEEYHADDILRTLQLVKKISSNKKQSD